MTESGTKCGVEHILEDFPSPANPEEIEFQIDCLKDFLSRERPGPERAKALLKTADLMVGRNAPGDYRSALKLYDEILSSTLPGEEENIKASIGKAELSLPLSSSTAEIEKAIEEAKKASSLLAKKPADFFYAKALSVEAELLLKLGGSREREEALRLYEEIISKPSTNYYFRLRAVVGALDLLQAFYKPELAAKYDRYTDALREALESFNDSRPNDYFHIKGIILLSEIMLLKDKDSLGENAKNLLMEAINNDSASDDLRARASLSLAEVSSSGLAKTLIRGIRKMEGIDPYLLRRASAIEDALNRKNPS